MVRQMQWKFVVVIIQPFRSVGFVSNEQQEYCICCRTNSSNESKLEALSSSRLQTDTHIRFV